MKKEIQELLREKLFGNNEDKRFDIDETMSICERAWLPEDDKEREKVLYYLVEDICQIYLNTIFGQNKPTDTYTSIN
jgi:hypothetical protein